MAEAEAHPASVRTELVIVTGMSGAGRTTTANVLEDSGWYVVDNLPPHLLLPLTELASQRSGSGELPRIAAVVDVRARGFFTHLRGALAELRERGWHPNLVFLDATDEALVRRFESVRRPHPLQGEGRLLDGIVRERDMLQDLRADADVVIDTSGLNVHQLAKKVAPVFSEAGPKVRIAVMSFGFKYGIPLDADFVFDMRFLPNPYWIPELRHFNGKDEPVADFVMGQEGAPEFVDRVVDLMRPVTSGYIREGRRYVTIAVGCTGGKHRSVADLGGPGHGPRHRRHRDLRRAPRPGAGVSGPSVVALGGGHGLAASLSALKLISDDITAVVTVADNGGSSGRLRDEFDVLPPGDLRMALSALCDDSEWGHTWRDVLQHRFRGTGPLGGHSVGNLLIVALWELHKDPVAGLDLVGRLLNSRGRVLPMAAVPLEIEAEVQGADPLLPDEVSTVRGQVAVASTTGRVRSIALDPADPPAPEATVRAVEHADWVILGPGLVVHLGHAPPHGARPAGCAPRHPCPATAHAQRRALGRDRRVLRSAAPRGPRRARATAAARRRARRPRRHRRR